MVLCSWTFFWSSFLVLLCSTSRGGGGAQGRKTVLGWWLIGIESTVAGMAWRCRSHRDQSLCRCRSWSRIHLGSSRLDLNGLPLPLRRSPKGSSTSPNSVTSWTLSVQTASGVHIASKWWQNFFPSATPDSRLLVCAVFCNLVRKI